MDDVNHALSVIPLNGNGLNPATQRQGLKEWIKKTQV